MANNYLEFSETLEELQAKEEAWLREQLEIVCVRDGQEYVGEQPPDEWAGQDCWIGCRAWRDFPEFDPDYDATTGFEYVFSGSHEHEGRYLWLYSEEHGCPEQAAHLAQKFLRKFRPAQFWTLSYATTCSKPRVGEFGGGCIFVTASEIMWCSTGNFLTARIEAFRGRAAGNASSPLRSFDLAIDGALLRTQRKQLLELMDALQKGEQARLDSVDTDLLEGLINLTDELADQADAYYGIDCPLSADEEGGAS